MGTEKVKRDKIGLRLLLRTNRKSHMRFRLVPKSMTLDDLERSMHSVSKHVRNGVVILFVVLNSNRFLVDK